jgi:hypothetical protein
MKNWIWILIAIAFIGGLIFLIKSPAKAGKLDDFATCIKNSGAKFYGAFWCPHCRDQKAMFGSSVKFLPYVECSTPDGRSQNNTCNDAGIRGYPTWFFSNSLSLESPEAPHKCTADPNESQLCKNNYDPSHDVWQIGSNAVESKAAPTQDGNVWTFIPGSSILGTISLQTLSEASRCSLPQ